MEQEPKYAKFAKNRLWLKTWKDMKVVARDVDKKERKFHKTSIDNIEEMMWREI